MLQLEIKPNHKLIEKYYEALKKQQHIGQEHEGAISDAFAKLLGECCDKLKLNFTRQYQYQHEPRALQFDGAVLGQSNLRYGVWEAKDYQDCLEKEIPKKFAAGYPSDNILFQRPDRAILYRHGSAILIADLTQPTELVQVLKTFLEYIPLTFDEWEKVAEEFKQRIPEIAKIAIQIIQDRMAYQDVKTAIQDLHELCKASINPNISDAAILEMMVQHLLTERIFRGVLNNPDFVRRNPIAQEMEKVMDALTKHDFNREIFLNPLQHFYVTIEKTAASVQSFQEKQTFLNAIYERFFQGFSKKTADTHGIVYTPYPIVEFMLNSVEEILKKEFGKSLSDAGVNIIDPFVGTGNFIVHLMQRIPKSSLPHKYKHELWCNEIMLMPYYIAAMNIEHAYYQATGEYKEFPGICLVDTFQTAEQDAGTQINCLSEANALRVQEQQKKNFFVIIGNPPYNARQANENENNKNTKHPVVDGRVKETYVQGSTATNRNALSDPYIKAFRWASDRIVRHGQGMVAFVSNNSFLEDICFDGMRQCLQGEFDAIYIVDLGGNVRKNPKLSGTTHNVFGIQVGVCMTFLIRKKSTPQKNKSLAQIFYTRMDEFDRKEQKFTLLEQARNISKLDWQELHPTNKHVWLTQGLADDFDAFLPLGTKQAKAGKDDAEMTIFRMYSNGVKTNRDAWVYNFDRRALISNVKRMMSSYNAEVHRYEDAQINPKEIDDAEAQHDEDAQINPKEIDDFVSYDDTKIKWSEGMKAKLAAGKQHKFSRQQIRTSLYRPFHKQFLYFDATFNERRYQFPHIFPTLASEQENRVICVSAIGNNKPFQTLMAKIIPDLHLVGDSQCFPFYSYQEDGTGRIENITDQALAAFQQHYQDTSINKWDIFYYVYAVLQHPEYAARYGANLRNELPRIPYLPKFGQYAQAGKQLAALHCDYEEQAEYRLQRVENPEAQLNYRVEKMRLSKDKTAIEYNDFLTLTGIPAATFEYRLGNRSAIEWLIDQYQDTTDPRSQIRNDPNDIENPEHIIHLIGKIITVSLETIRILKTLPGI